MLPARHRSPLLLLCGVLLLGIAGCDRGPEALLARSTSGTTAAASTPQPSLDPAEFNAVLARVVDGRGMVDYAALQRQPAQLDRYLQALAELPPERFASWSEAEQIALLINAYNAFTLRLILDHAPVEYVLRHHWSQRKVDHFDQELAVRHDRHCRLLEPEVALRHQTNRPPRQYPS